MLERDAELARLRALLAETHIGGRVVLIRGEAGIGKTVLARRFVDEVAGWCDVHLGTCDDLDTAQPLAPIWDVARGDPDLAVALESGNPRRVMDAMLDLLSPQGSPAVLVVEDTQWADDATLDMITFLGRRMDRANGLLVLTYRDGEVDADHPLRRVLGDLPPAAVERMRLSPLSVAAVAALVGGRAVDPDAVVALTGGNPLFVTEVLASGGQPVPASLRDAVHARVARLTYPARDLVDFMSLVPGGAEWSLVRRLVGDDAEAAREGVQQGLLDVTDEGVAFRHELQRRAVQASLPPDDRRRRHAAVLDSLGDEADPARLVHHARLAHDRDALVAHALRAGRAAMVARSHREAHAHFRAVSAHLDQLPAQEAADAADGWARAAFHLNLAETPDLVVRAVALRRAAGDRPALARTLAFGAFALQAHGRSEQGQAHAAEAVELADRRPPGRELAYALTEQARLHLWHVDSDAGLDAATRAAAIADELNDRRTAASALILAGMFRHLQGHDGGEALVERARRRATRDEHRFEEADALLTLGELHVARYDIAGAVRCFDRAGALADDHEFGDVGLWSRARRAQMLEWSGDWTTAEDEASEILGASLTPDIEALALQTLATIAARCGRADAHAAIERMWAAARRIDQPWMITRAASVAAEYLWLTDNRQDVWLSTLDHVLKTRVRGPTIRATDDLAFWMWKLDRLADAPPRLTAGFRWILDDDAGRATEFWAARRMPYHHVVALMHGSDRDAVRAVHRFEDMGADGAVRRLRAALRERGITVARGRSQSTRDHVAGLTARQAEVLDLLADGLTNTDIADHLFISPRTVENHVAAVLRKLRAAGRDEAVAIAQTRGLLREV